MKKRLLLAISSFVAVFTLLPAVALAIPTQTIVSGTVTYNGSPVSGAKVTVVCDNNAKHTLTTSAGAYGVVYSPATLCPDGSKATVVATNGPKGGVNSGEINSATKEINVAIINVSLPEFGVIAGVGAAVIGGGAFLVIRRRQLGANKA